MKGFEYDYILRPNYEARAFWGWVVGGLGVLWLYLHLDFPPLAFEVMGFLCGAMALGRGWAAALRAMRHRTMKRGGQKQLVEYHSWKGIKAKALPFRMRKLLEAVSATRDKIMHKTHFKREYAWLGTGFPWAQHEIQKATEILNSAKATFLTESEGMWIHGLGGHKSQDLEIPTRLLEGHLMVVGSTGTGKTRLFDLLIAQAIFRNETVIIIDPKGDDDLSEKTQRACERMGAAQRYMYFHLAHPDKSIRLDPMKNWHRATELASRIAALIPSETKVDPFQAFGWMAMNSIIQGLVYLDSQPSLMKLRKHVETSPEDILWQALRRYFSQHCPSLTIKPKLEDVIKQYQQTNTEKPELAIEGLVTSYLHNREHFQKMVSSLIPLLSMLTSGDLRYMLSPHEDDGDPRPALDLATVIERNAVLYVGLDSLSDSPVGSALGSILLTDLTAVASDRYNYGEKGYDYSPVNVFIDEVAETVNDPAIQLLNKGRGAGFRVVIAMQTLADLEVRIGTKAGARQVVGNTNNWIFFRVIDGETQKYISEALPKTVVKNLDQGYRTATGSDDPAKFSSTYTEALSQQETEMFPSALLGMLPPFHFFCRLANGTTWKSKLPVVEYDCSRRRCSRGYCRLVRILHGHWKMPLEKKRCPFLSGRDANLGKAPKNSMNQTAI